LSTCQKQYGWCGKKSNPELVEVNWAQGQPDQAAGDCVFARFSNSSVNESVMALENCSQKMNFVCEVRNKVGEDECINGRELCFVLESEGYY
jgi:hypothetical protein